MGSELDCVRDCNGACCNWIFLTPGGMGREDWRLMQLRGARKLPDGRIALPSPCSALAGAKCSIYSTRPLPCRVMKVGGPDCLAARRLEGFRPPPSAPPPTPDV